MGSPRSGIQLAGVLALAGAVAQSNATELTQAQRETIDRGQSVVVTRERTQSSWPAVTVYIFVSASPEETAAVFTDYDRHRTFIPGLTRSHVAQVLDPTTVDVDYTLEVPILSDEQYTVRDHVSRLHDTLLVDWILLKATSTKATIGHARFSPYTNSVTRTAGTLLEYYDFVTPGSRLSGLGFVKRRAIHSVDEAAHAIARRVETERGHATTMDRRLAKLRAALAGRATPN